MLQKLKYSLLACCLLLTTGTAMAQGYLRASGKEIVNDGGPVLLRGIGLGGWMLQEPYMLQLNGVLRTQTAFRNRIEAIIGKERTDAFYKQWLASHCTKADIDSLAAWGLNSVRLPMHYNLFTLPAEQEKGNGQTWLPHGFALVDSLLQWCKANKVYLILDLHAAPGGQGNDISISDRDTTQPSLWQSEKNKTKTIALWEQLAKRYKNETWIGGYDILNETNWGFADVTDKHGCAEKENKDLRDLLMRITQAIRKIDKQHLIFIEGNCWANNYSGMFPLWDNNMAVSFHKYWNYNDQASVQGFVDIRNKHNVPVWMGESGENSNVWFTAAIQRLEQNNIGWNWWPLKKLGRNNPFEIAQNKDYTQLINYWKGTAPQPTAEQVYNGLMQLAADTRTASTTYHKDVVDAMRRQIASNATLPYAGNKIQHNSVVFATDYDMGRQGEAYYDEDSVDHHVSTGNTVHWNQGFQYRNDGVDIEFCKDELTNGYNVGWIASGEWLQYTVQVQQDGIYDIDIRSAAKDIKGELTLIINGKAVKSIDLPVTHGYQNWATKTFSGIPLSKGENKIRLLATKGGFNLNYFRFMNAVSGVQTN